jgi:hypothetical protein
MAGDTRQEAENFSRFASCASSRTFLSEMLLLFEAHKRIKDTGDDQGRNYRHENCCEQGFSFKRSRRGRRSSQSGASAGEFDRKEFFLRRSSFRKSHRPESSFDRKRQRAQDAKQGGAVCPRYGRGIQPVPVKLCITTTRNAQKAKRLKTVIASLVRVGCRYAAIAQDSMRKASDLSREQVEFRTLAASLRLTAQGRGVCEH